MSFTFADLYGDRLNAELGSADTTQLFKTALRKSAINQAQTDFVTLTGCLTVIGTKVLSDGVGEYDLEAMASNFMRLSRAPEIKKVDANAKVTWIHGPDDLRETSITELNGRESGWRTATASTPARWYLDQDSGKLNLGFYPSPKILAGETWTAYIPYVVIPADMSLDTDFPFTVAGNPLTSLGPYHQGLAHRAAAILEGLRKNYPAVDRQQQLFMGFVATYFQRPRLRRHVTFARSYYGESFKGRPLDPRRFP